MNMIRVAAVVGALALLSAACGSSSPTSTTKTTQSFQGAATQAFKFAACMRNHGVTNFPDPQVTDNGTQRSIRIQAVGPDNPQFKTASKDCAGILPMPSNADLAAQAAAQQTRTRDLLSFARCMRGRGINGFPDPGLQGQLTVAMINAAGIDLHAPQVAIAARACLPASKGVITRAAVAQATGSSG